MKVTLPNFMKYKPAVDLIRVGRDYDGGYLVSKKDVEASEILISLGISQDWSFEEEFCTHSKVPVIAYDASVSKRFLLKQTIKSFLYIHKFKTFLRSFCAYFYFKNFFKAPNKHIKKFVGIDPNHQYIPLTSVFKETTSQKIFFKIDIEGDEYRILGDLIDNADRLTGLAIEFHDFDFHLPRIKFFIDKFPMPLVHIHANNYPELSPEGLPTVLELTFSGNAELADQYVLPHPLDMPNNKCSDEIILAFS